MNKYNVYTLTKEQLAQMIASGNDAKRNQIRIDKNGMIFLSTVVGAEGLDGIAGRFETFDANNGYVGETAASNPQYIEKLFGVIQRWIANPKSYIDNWLCE